MLFSKFRHNWLLSYRWIEKQAGGDQLEDSCRFGGKFCSSYNYNAISIRISLVDLLLPLIPQSEPSPQEQIQHLPGTWFDSILIADWEMMKG